MAISDVLLEGDSHLRHVSTIDKEDGGLKSEDFRGNVIYGAPSPKFVAWKN